MRETKAPDQDGRDDDGQPDNLDREFREIIERATDDLPPPPDLVPGAIRRGRRGRARSRAVIGVVAVAAVGAITAPALLLAPWAGTRTERAGSVWSGEMPLIPKSWPLDQPLAAPTTAYPTVHVPPTEPAYGKPPTKDEAELRYAFKQKVADVFTKLLPADVGQLKVPDLSANDYLLVSGGRTFHITFRTDLDSNPQGPRPNDTCAQSRAKQEQSGAKVVLPCADARLPDGTTIGVNSLVEIRETGGESGRRTGTSDPAPNPITPMADFMYHDAEVMLTIFAERETGVLPPVSNEQLAKVVGDPTFLELVDFWRTHPIR
jgi:hypothetical protein